MNSEKIFFNSIKEDRGWYFVEYSPPQESARFATVDLVITADRDKTEIVQALETEVRAWLARYAVPLMASAFDATGTLIHLDPIKECNSLMGFLPKGQEAMQLSWRLLKNEEMPNDALNREHLKSVYSDIPFRTEDDIERECKKQARAVKTVKWFFLFLGVVVPLTAIILAETSVWIARIVLAFSLWKIVVELLKRTGKWKKSSRQVEKEKEELEMRHHHYHCKMNPEAFRRLRNENIERLEKERIQRDAESLKIATPSSAATTPLAAERHDEFRERRKEMRKRVNQ